MAIISIGSYNGRDVKYSDVTQKFTMNPYDGNSAMKAITGWNNTELSVQELSDTHNGVTIFAGRSDYSGIASGFKLRLAPVGAVFSATEKIEWKKYVDRDPELSYSGSTEFIQENIGLSTDLTIDVYIGQIYATTFIYTANFIDGTYGAYNFPISYTDPDTGRIGAIVGGIDVTFSESSASPLDDPLSWQLATDEFNLMENPTTDYFENTNPTGIAKINKRVATNNVVADSTSIYSGTGHTTETQRLIRRGAYFDNTLDIPDSNAPFIEDDGSPVADILDPTKVGFIEGWVKGTGSFFMASRSNSAFADTTGLYQDTAGVIYPIIGGEFGNTRATVIQNEWKHFYLYIDGVTGLHDLYINGVEIFRGKTTEMGTNVANRKIVVGGKWNTASEVDPLTDAQQSTGGEIPLIRFGTQRLTEKEIQALYIRNKKHYVLAMPGDSVTAGTGSSIPWGTLLQENGDTFYHRFQLVDYSVSGQTSYNSLPTTPFTGYSSKAPWVTSGRNTPSVQQDAEYVLSSCSPEIVIEGFTQNDVRAGAVIKNPSPTGIGEDVGWGTYGDELYWAAKHKESFWVDKGARYFWLACGAVTDDTTLIGEDSLPLEDALRSVHDGIFNNATDVNILYAQQWTRVSDLDNSLKLEYDFGDETHYNNAWHLEYYTNNVKLLVNDTLDETRDFKFDPVVLITSPLDGATLYINPVDVTYSHDGTVANDQSTLSIGIVDISRSFVNTYGRSGSASITVTKFAETYPDDLADMNYDSKDGVFTLFDGDTTVDDWQNSGTLSGTRAFVADADRMEVDVNSSGVNGFKGNLSTGDKTLKMVETSGETYKTSEFCMLFCFEYQNNGSLEMLFDRKVSSETDGFWLYTNGSGSITLRWVNSSDSVFEQQFTGFTNGDLVQVFINVNANVMNVYASNGQSRLGATLKTMSTVDSFWLGSLEGGGSRSNSPIYSFKCYPREITEAERTSFQSYFVDKYTP